MVIQHNLLAMNSNRMLGINDKKRVKTTEKLSSGYRINRAADDAAGVAISEKMRRQIRGLTQASQNCQDGVSMVQIADGALSEVDAMLDRCTELSVKAANGTLSNDDRSYIESEIEQIKAEIDAIRERTTFNEIPVLQGDNAVIQHSTGGAAVMGGLPSWVNGGSSLAAGKMQDQVNIYGSNYLGGTIDFTALDSNPAQFSKKLKELTDTKSGFNFTCCTCDDHYSVKFVTGPAKGPQRSGGHTIYEVSTDGITSSSQLVSSILSTTGNPVGGHLVKARANGGKLELYDSRYTSRSGVDSTRGLLLPGVAYDSNNLPQDEKVDIHIQAGAESGQRIRLLMPSVSCSDLGISVADVSTPEGADASITLFKDAKAYVSSERSRMGAYQNRLEHTIANLDNVVENTTAAESAIRDADMAKEMVQSSLQNILAQAGQSMLAQANQSSQGVLSLLG